MDLGKEQTVAALLRRAALQETVRAIAVQLQYSC